VEVNPKPRKDEIAAIQAVMDQEYDDEAAYAAAVWDCVVDLLGRRDSYLVAVKLAGTNVPFGPVYGLTQAKKLGGRFAGELRTEAFIQAMRAPEGLEDPSLKETEVHE
jgi:hypothetical protein